MNNNNYPFIFQSTEPYSGPIRYTLGAKPEKVPRVNLDQVLSVSDFDIWFLENFKPVTDKIKDLECDTGACYTETKEYEALYRFIYELSVDIVTGFSEAEEHMNRTGIEIYQASSLLLEVLFSLSPKPVTIPVYSRTDDISNVAEFRHWFEVNVIEPYRTGEEVIVENGTFDGSEYEDAWDFMAYTLSETIMVLIKNDDLFNNAFHMYSVATKLLEVKRIFWM